MPIRHLEAAFTDSDGTPSQNMQVESEVDGPGLLFYYLFDDWYATYALLAKEEHHYGSELKRLV